MSCPHRAFYSRIQQNSHPLQAGLNVLFYLTFPKHQHFPASLGKALAMLEIPLLVTGKFGLPKIGIVLWLGELANGASVPVAAMHEYGDFPAWKGDVRFAGGLLPMNPVPADARRPKGLAQLQLWLGVLALIGPHVLGHGLIGRWRGAEVPRIRLWFSLLSQF